MEEKSGSEVVALMRGYEKRPGIGVGPAIRHNPETRGTPARPQIFSHTFLRYIQ